jgi:hypothetical protein
MSLGRFLFLAIIVLDPLPVLAILIPFIINLNELYPILFFVISIDNPDSRLSAFAFQRLASELLGLEDFRRMDAEV